MKAPVIRVNAGSKKYKEFSKAFCTLVKDENCDANLGMISNYDDVQKDIVSVALRRINTKRIKEIIKYC